MLEVRLGDRVKDALKRLELLVANITNRIVSRCWIVVESGSFSGVCHLFKLIFVVTVVCDDAVANVM